MKRINVSEGIRFGVGVDSHTEEPRGNALAFQGTNKESGGQTTTAQFKMIESQESLMESMNLSVGVSARYGLASADARFDFAKSHAVNSFSTYVLLKATVRNPPEHMIQPALTPEAAALYQRSPEDFRQTFGDSFVDEIYSGGEFFGLFTFESRDESSKTEVSAKLNVSIGTALAGGEINVAFKNTLEELSRNTTMVINVFRSGGLGLANPSQFTELVDLYKSFNAAVVNHGTPYQAALKEFRYLPLPAGPTWVEHAVRADTVATCGRYVIQGIKLRSSIEYVLGHPDQFEAFDAAALREQLRALESRFPLWAQRARDCVADVAQCNISGLEPIAIALPKRIPSNDPIDAKWQDILNNNSTAAPYFQASMLGGTSILRSDRGPRGGRFKFFRRDGTGAPVSGIFWHPDVGAHGVYGPIFDAYIARGHCEGPLGYPKTDEAALDNLSGGDGVDRVSYFENGLLWLDKQTNVVSNELRPIAERPFVEAPRPRGIPGLR